MATASTIFPVKVMFLALRKPSSTRSSALLDMARLDLPEILRRYGAAVGSYRNLTQPEQGLSPVVLTL